MFVITKKFRFSAAHQLTGLPEGHKCARLHGHDYEVEWVLAAESLDPAGMVLDFGELSATVGQLIDEELDHRNLNDVLPVAATAENLASWLFDQVRARSSNDSRWQLVRQLTRQVTVWETPTCSATYAPWGAAR